MDEWANGRMDEWTNGRMGEWANTRRECPVRDIGSVDFGETVKFG